MLVSTRKVRVRLTWGSLAQLPNNVPLFSTSAK